MDKDHNHVVTVNLKIIMNNKLHKLFSKGPKYRENGTADYLKVKESIITMTKSFIQSYCNNYFVTTLSVLNGNSM